MKIPKIVKHRDGHCIYDDSLVCGVHESLCNSCAGIPTTFGTGAVKTHYKTEEITRFHLRVKAESKLFQVNRKDIEGASQEVGKNAEKVQEV